MSNFFRDASLSFKPRSNIFSKLRVKDTEVGNESSNTQEGNSSAEDLFLDSNKDDGTSPATTLIHSDAPKLGNGFQLRSSTPEPVECKQSKAGDGLLEEDDLEITEVRDVPISNGEIGARNDLLESNHIGVPAVIVGPGQQQSVRECDIDASSNDVLLEAFTNTQKICSNLKQELNKVQNENSKLKTHVQSYQSDKEKIMDRLAEYRNLLNSFNEKSKSLFEQKRKEDFQLKEFTENYEKILKKVENYKDDIHGLKRNLSQLRFLKKDSETEIAKKNKEIEYLKRELDNCSGQLSEEKLKNSSLVQEFGKIRKELVESLNQNYSVGQSRILEKIEVFESNIVNSYHVQFNNFSESSISKLTECIGTLQKNISADLNMSFDKKNQYFFNDYQKSLAEFMGRFNQIDKSQNELFSRIQGCATLQDEKFEICTKSLVAELERRKHESLELLRKCSNENENHLRKIQDEVNNNNSSSLLLFERTSNECAVISRNIKDGFLRYQSEALGLLQKHLQKLPELLDESRESRAESKEYMEKLSKELLSYKDNLTNARNYEADISVLQSQIASLKLEKTQVMSCLETKETQYEELCNSLRSKETELSRFEEIKKGLHIKIERISSEVEQQKDKWSKLNEENITLRANSENKLMVQEELLKAFQSENKTLKQRAAQLEDMRQQYEKENSLRLDKIQRINEQLQKLNVEMVQLKAHELELEEENRNLKRIVEDNKLEYEDTADDFKRLKQKVIVLESDKQDIVSEKLELREQVERLQGVVNRLKQKVSSLQKSEENYVKEIKEQATKLEEIPKQLKLLRGPDKQEIGIHKSSKREVEELAAPSMKLHVPSLPPPPPSNQPQLKSNSKDKEEIDEFDLSSSLNDDLELTNPSPIKSVIAKRGNTKNKPVVCARKKLLLLDEQDSTPLKRRWKKRRT